MMKKYFPICLAFLIGNIIITNIQNNTLKIGRGGTPLAKNGGNTPLGIRDRRSLYWLVFFYNNVS